MSHLHAVWKDGCKVYYWLDYWNDTTFAVVAVDLDDAVEALREITGAVIERGDVVLYDRIHAVTAWANANTDITSGST
jgi:hypothetical protein